jgi:delta 1-pyrroline-5-carboxylate dehydrogenase
MLTLSDVTEAQNLTYIPNRANPNLRRHPPKNNPKNQGTLVSKSISSILTYIMASHKPPKYETRLYVDNKFVTASSEETITVRNPFNDAFIASVPCASVADVDLAVASSKNAFYSGEWSAFSGEKRAKCLFKLAELLEAHAGEFGRLETLAMGAPVAITTEQAYGAGAFVRYYASLADKIGGESFPDDGDDVYKVKFDHFPSFSLIKL